VTRLSSSFEVPANMKVNPFMLVSIGEVEDVLDGLGCCCRTTNVKLNINSSSFCSFNRKTGGDDGGTSGSYCL
jgi:hypothetical protein